MTKDEFILKFMSDIRRKKAEQLKRTEYELSGFYRQRTWAGGRRNFKIVGYRIPKSVVI